MKRIGLLSDTHGYWDYRYETYFKDCDEIWHAGDIGSTARSFATLKSLSWRKTNKGRIRHSLSRYRPSCNKYKKGATPMGLLLF